jgi:UDP-2-acetamido-2-deoxy-ribo-hexuluronate aminotransferase
VIEDNAQAIGADYYLKSGKQQKAGTIGHIGCTSFFPSKNLGCYGDGGAIFTNDDAIAKKIRMIANHGQSVLYYHDEIGVNSRLDSIQAAILRIKLRHLDEYAAARRACADFYDKAFAGHPNIITPERTSLSNHVFHQYTMILKDADRNKLKEYLATKEIPAMIYYPIPLHMQKAYRDPRYKEGDFPVTEKLCSSVISLPIHTEMTPDVLSYVAENVSAFFKK